MSGIEVSERKVVVLLDLRPKAGNMLSAFIELRTTFHTGIYYYGVCDSQVEQEWLHDQAVCDVRERIEKGEVLLASGKPIQFDMPTDLMTEAPQLPSLNLCVYGGANRRQMH